MALYSKHMELYVNISLYTVCIDLIVTSSRILKLFSVTFDDAH